MEMNSSSNDSLNGLKFGKKIYFEDVGGGGGSSSSSSSKAPAAAAALAKKGKGAVQGGGQPPRCQVEGCRVDLTGSKTYYCKHKVCGMHSKAPKVVLAGLEQRFCQQCSRINAKNVWMNDGWTYKAEQGYTVKEAEYTYDRACHWFHQLPEFDQGKRSCRRRLAGHNERRRKPPRGSLSSRFGRLSSLFHEDSSKFRSFLMDFAYPRLPGAARDVWSNVRTSDRVATNQWQGSLVTPHSAVAVHDAHQHMRHLMSASEFPPGQCITGVTDTSCALSLLSTKPWGTTACRDHRALSISGNGSFDGAAMAQSDANACMNHLWSLKGHGADSSSYEIQHNMGIGHAGERGGCQFSGELELALQGNEQCPDHGVVPAYDHTGHVMRWPL